MDAYAYYLGSATLFGVSTYLFKGTAPWSNLGCKQYEKAQITRLFAIILLILAVMVLFMGVLAQNAGDPVNDIDHSAGTLASTHS